MHGCPYMYQLNRQCHWALTSAGRRVDLSPTGFALLLDRDHWRLLRSELGDGTCEVKGVAFAADSNNPARMICNCRFWLVWLARALKGSRFARHTDVTIPRVGSGRSRATFHWCVALRLRGTRLAYPSKIPRLPWAHRDCDVLYDLWFAILTLLYSRFHSRFFLLFVGGLFHSLADDLDLLLVRFRDPGKCRGPGMSGGQIH